MSDKVLPRDMAPGQVVGGLLILSVESSEKRAWSWRASVRCARCGHEFWLALGSLWAREHYPDRCGEGCRRCNEAGGARPESARRLDKPYKGAVDRRGHIWLALTNGTSWSRTA